MCISNILICESDYTYREGSRCGGELLSMWQLQMQIDPGVDLATQNQTIGDVTAGLGGRDF